MIFRFPTRPRSGRVPPGLMREAAIMRRDYQAEARDPFTIREVL